MRCYAKAMISFQSGRKFANCTRTSRRGFLCAGAAGIAGIAGLSLPKILAAEKLAGNTPTGKSIIVIHLDGGPPQMDLIDPKPYAPVDVRSPFAPITTNVPGVQLTELMPQCAKSPTA